MTTICWLTQSILPAADFGSADDVTVYRARKQGVPVAALFTVTAPDGYSGQHPPDCWGQRRSNPCRRARAIVIRKPPA